MAVENDSINKMKNFSETSSVFYLRMLLLLPLWIRYGTSEVLKVYR